jgi:hypothetical protein
MTLATIVPDDTLGFARRMSADIEPSKIKELRADTLLNYNFACKLLRVIFASARKSVEADLREGVDAKEFAKKSEKTIGELDAIFDVMRRVALSVQVGQLSPQAAEFIANFRDLACSVESLRGFMVQAVSVAKAPAHEIDWQKMEESAPAYTRGETKPFRRLTTRESPR